MASPREIRAGKAVVELGTNNSALVRGLNQASSQLASFAKNAMKVGAGLFAVGSAGVGIIAAMSKIGSDQGDALVKYASVTGLATESLTALQYAAEQSSVEFGSLISAYTKMQKNIGGGLPKLLQVADAIKGAKDPAEKTRIAIAAFGKSGADLLPLLENGSQGITDMMDEAKSLGLLMDGDTAKALDDFGDRVAGMWSQIKRMNAELAAAVAVAFLPYTGAIQSALDAVIQFVKEHRNAAVWFAIASVSIAGLGAAIIAFGGVALGASMAISGIVTAFGLMSAIIEGVISATLMLASPLFLVAMGALAIAGGFLFLTETGQRVLGMFKTSFGNVLSTVTTTLKGVANALIAGNLPLAAQIATKGIELAFAELIDPIKELWDEVTDYMMNALAKVAMKIATLVTSAGATAGKGAVALLKSLGFNPDQPQSQQPTVPGSASAGKKADQDELARKAKEERKKQREAELEKLRAELKTLTDQAAAEAGGSQDPIENLKKKLAGKLKFGMPDMNMEGLSNDLKTTAKVGFGSAQSFQGGISGAIQNNIKNILSGVNKIADNTSDIDLTFG